MKNAIDKKNIDIFNALQVFIKQPNMFG